MLDQVQGILRGLNEGALLLEWQGLVFEVQVPAFLLDPGTFTIGQPLSLYTRLYFQGSGMNNLYPVLLGFGSRQERDFFDKITSVEGIGPRAALRAMTIPVAEIARAIETEDVRLLSSLPGIGKQRASQIIAKLRGKLTPFLAPGEERAPRSPAPARTAADPAREMEEEAMAILLQLGYKKPEAEKMLQNALARNQKITSAEELIQEVFRG